MPGTVLGKGSQFSDKYPCLCDACLSVKAWARTLRKHKENNVTLCRNIKQDVLFRKDGMTGEAAYPDEEGHVVTASKWAEKQVKTGDLGRHSAQQLGCLLGYPNGVAGFKCLLLPLFYLPADAHSGNIR